MIKRYLLFSCLFFTASFMLFLLLADLWCQLHFGQLALEHIVFFMTTDISGTEQALLNDFAMVVIVPWLLIIILFSFLFYRIKFLRLSLTCFFVVFSIGVAFNIIKSYAVADFFRNRFIVSDFYEKNYVDTHTASITAPEHKRNLIVIYAESLANAYGDMDGNNYIPLLSQLKKDNLSFAGFVEGYVQGWTQGAMYSSFLGIPTNYYNKRYLTFLCGINPEKSQMKSIMLAKKIVALSDILKQNGYSTLFVKGAGLQFTYTGDFFAAHSFAHNDIYGYSEIKERYPNREWHLNGWGIYDKDLLPLFKELLLKKANAEQPFLAVMLTLDTHYMVGADKDLYKTVYPMTDKLLHDFMVWVKKQPFYDNSTVVVMGDHLNGHVRDGVQFKDKTIYNVFINSPVTVTDRDRVFNQTDMMPTLLESIGFKIAGGRLGIGTSLFSGQKTFSEIYGQAELDRLLAQGNRLYNSLWE